MEFPMNEKVATSAEIQASLDQMAAFDAKASQAVENAMREFASLSEQRVRALANIERLQSDLAGLEARMKKDYGCDTLEQLLEKTKNMQNEFRKQYAEFWTALQGVRAALNGEGTKEEE
jgi:chromosome segregation ATPase